MQVQYARRAADKQVIFEIEATKQDRLYEKIRMNYRFRSALSKPKYASCTIKTLVGLGHRSSFMLAPRQAVCIGFFAENVKTELLRDYEVFDGN